MHAEHTPDWFGAERTAAEVDDDLAAERLDAAEACLDEREKLALADGASAGDLAALAAERDEVARRRDHQALAHDARAARRDSGSLRRDATSSARDVHARAADADLDPGFPDRFLSACDRDWAAADRAASVGDRVRASRDRERAARDRERAALDRARALEGLAGLEHELATLHGALDSRNVIGQAQGLLMARYHIDADEAFAMLVRLSQTMQLKLRLVAARLVESVVADRSE